MSSSSRLLLRRSLKLSPERRSAAFELPLSLGFRFSLESRGTRLVGVFESASDSSSVGLFALVFEAPAFLYGFLLSFLLVLSSACSSKME